MTLTLKNTCHNIRFTLANGLSHDLAHGLCGADDHAKKVAQRLQKDTLLAEKRSRVLRAIRQTYEDFFNLDYIDSGHVYSLKASSFPICSENAHY